MIYFYLNYTNVNNVMSWAHTFNQSNLIINGYDAFIGDLNFIQKCYFKNCVINCASCTTGVKFTIPYYPL